MDFKSLSDPVVIVGEKNSKPSFFKRIREPFSKFSPKFKKTLAVTLTVFMVFALSVGVYLSRQPTQLTPQASTDGVDLSLKPDNIVTNIDQEFQVDVFVDTGQTDLKLAAVQAKINYDSAKLELKNVQLKDFLPTVLIQPQNTAGSTKFVVGISPSDTPKGGSGTIATLTFKVIQSATSPISISFEPGQTLVAADGRTDNVAGDLNPASVNIGDMVQQSPSPVPSPTLNPNPETSFTLEGPNAVTAGQEFSVKIYTRTDVDAANLWVTDITFPEDTLEVVGIDKTGSVVDSWATEHFDNQLGEITLVGGIPTPGLKTNKQNSLLSTIIFKGKANGTANISLTNNSQIYRNSDNVNILQNKRNTSVTISGAANASPSPSASASPSPSPSPSSSASIPAGKGDGDNNGTVDRRDLSILYSHWSPAQDITSSFQLDFNDDRRINTFDLTQMANLLFSLGVIRR